MACEKLHTKWLSDQLLNQIIQSDEELKGKSVKIRSFKWEEATNPGDNYSSDVHRLTIECSDEFRTEYKTKSFVIKCMYPIDTTVGKTLKDTCLFEKEINMYRESLVKIEEVISSIGDDLSVSPKLLLFTEAPYELLVMEDLCTLGFKMAERINGLDEEHCRLVFTKLAKYHAASMYLNRKDPKFRSLYNKGSFYEGMPEKMTSYFMNGITQGTDTMRRMPSCQKYVKFFEKYATEIIADGTNIQKRVPEDCFDFNVLAHGGLWINNMMFKYNNDGKPIDVKFVDYQMANFTSPGMDINYFLLTGASDDTRDKYRDELLTVYITTLRSTLQKLKHDALIPTREDLDYQLVKSKGISLMTTCIVLPIVKMNKETSSTITTDGLMDSPESETRINMFTNKLYENSLEVALRHLEDIGFITISD